ncbi:MAG: hypothetical protein KDB50_14155, partial [Mycobacterium sp.]|nr:hypothetical protein [Mycobacterium sp.]
GQAELSGTLGPITAGPVELAFIDGQALTGVIGGPDKGIGLTGQAGVGPIVIPLPWSVLSDPDAPITIPAFPWFYDLMAGLDIPITGTTGQLDADEFAADIPYLLDAMLQIGYCIVGSCTPNGVFGNVGLFNQNGSWPNFTVVPPWDTIPVESGSLSEAFGPFIVQPIPINIPLEDSITDSDSGTLGPFVIPRG